MTVHELGVRVGITSAHPGQDLGVLTGDADLVSVSPVPRRVYTDAAKVVPDRGASVVEVGGGHALRHDHPPGIQHELAHLVVVDRGEPDDDPVVAQV